MDRMINIILVACSVIVAFIGLFFVLKIWLVWKWMDRTVLKAGVFLDEKFLARNWVYIFIACAFIVLRRILQLLGLLEIPISSEETILFDITGLAVVALLVLLAYYWYIPRLSAHTQTNITSGNRFMVVKIHFASDKKWNTQ